MKLSEIPDYKNKKLRRSTWVPKAYMVWQDGQWWDNCLYVEGYQLRPMEQDYESRNWDDWEEYVDWKGEVLERLHCFRVETEKKFYNIITEIYALQDWIKKI